ncbi:hypothetical protein [Nocardioides campestrisoli]|uniref:hypothetical protein n=1 Tax=Nocardioides campestrisoli TaxID=2736757 RepID=UPI0015E692EB|nr:hypothetical protein [Nocardioides campestrisoli]
MAAIVVLALVISGAMFGGSEDDDSRPTAQPTRAAGLSAPSTATPDDEASPSQRFVRFQEFPLDLGWDAYGPVVDPSSGTAGVQMPEWHPRGGVLYRSGYQDTLSASASGAFPLGAPKVGRTSGLTRGLLGYPNARVARSAFRALVEAVADWPVCMDPYGGKTAYSAEVYESIDEANAGPKSTTFTFAYTSDGAPFGVLYQFALVDDVLYGSSVYGGWTPQNAAERVAELDNENRPLIKLLPRIDRSQGS